ncbi:MAG: bifunctional adenosylcobinamide kinase/adenosylcobinamide-phosphate guanylyltransferase [Hyphomicrobium sp.]
MPTLSSGKLPRLTLILGGARSGKSALAEQLLSAEPGPWAYIATAQAFDDEMRVRIAQHRARRVDGWTTYDAPVELARALADQTAGQPVLVDCLTLWLTNLLLGSHDVVAATQSLIEVLAARDKPCILVANEVGLGIVPDNALARAFRDEAGRLNQRVATVVDRVLFVAAGLPLTLKG